MNTSYKIVITKVTTSKQAGRKWQKIRDVPDSLKKAAGFYDEKKKEIQEYGYVETEDEVTREEVIFSQSPHSLNLEAIIKAVNGIK